VAVVTALSVVFERICISRLKMFSVQTTIFITLGASIFARGGAMVVWGKENHSLPAFSGQGSVSVLGAAVPLQVLWVAGVAAAVIAMLYWWFNRTLFGLAMRSCAENRLGAQFVGINVRLMVTVSFAMSAALGALAGIVAAPLTFVSFDGGLILGIKGFVAAILGGSGTYLGPVIGGLALGVLESVSAGYISSTYKDSIAFALLILILTLRPAGLFSRWIAR